MHNVEVYSKDFENIIDNCPDGSFLFVDPPYLDTNQKNLYKHSFEDEEHNRLSKCLKRNSNRVKFMITYDDNKKVRELFSWADKIYSKEWSYAMSRTDYEESEREEGEEIFILNYKSPIMQQSSFDQF